MFKNRFVVTDNMGPTLYDADQEKEARSDYEVLKHAGTGVRFIDRAPKIIQLPKRRTTRKLNRAA